MLFPVPSFILLTSQEGTFGSSDSSSFSSVGLLSVIFESFFFPVSFHLASSLMDERSEGIYLILCPSTNTAFNMGRFSAQLHEGTTKLRPATFVKTDLSYHLQVDAYSNSQRLCLLLVI